MNPYFLVKKSWDAVARRLGEDTDEPGDFDARGGTIEAYGALESVYQRYKFITDFIARRTGDCSVKDFELVFLTVSPPEGVAFDEFQVRVKGFLEKTKSISRYFMAYEQRGTVGGDDIGRGRHVHIILDVSAPTSFANFKRGVGNIFRPWYWDCRPKLRAWELDKVSYLQGHKRPSKGSLIEGDRVWRLSQDLSPTYQSENW